MADRVREIMVLHAADQAGAERMQEDHHAQFFDAGKEFFQSGAGEVDSSNIGAEFDAAKSELFHGAVEFGQCHAGILQRHCAHTHQPVRMLRHHFGNVVVDDMAAVARHFRRRRIDEVAGIGRDHLHVDAGAVHLGKPRLQIGQLWKIDLAALRLDAFGEFIDMGVGVRRRAAAGNAGGVEHHRIGLGHQAVAMDVDGAPRSCFSATRGRAAMIGRGAADFALKQQGHVARFLAMSMKNISRNRSAAPGFISVPPRSTSPDLLP